MEYEFKITRKNVTYNRLELSNFMGYGLGLQSWLGYWLLFGSFRCWVQGKHRDRVTIMVSLGL